MPTTYHLNRALSLVSFWISGAWLFETSSTEYIHVAHSILSSPPYYLFLLSDYHYTICNKKYFSDDRFSYNSLCPNLEGIKGALFYKFRRPTIGRNCSALCTNKSGHRAAFSNERREAPRVSRGLLSRPLSLERSEIRGLFFVIAWW